MPPPARFEKKPTKNATLAITNLSLNAYKPGDIPLDIVDPQLLTGIKNDSTNTDTMGSTDWEAPESWQVQEEIVLDKQVTAAELFGSIPEFRANATWEQVGHELVQRLEDLHLKGKLSFIRVFTMGEGPSTFVTLAVRPFITAYELLGAACRRLFFDITSNFELELVVAGIGRSLEHQEFPILLQNFLLAKLGFAHEDLDRQGMEDNAYLFQFRLRPTAMQSSQDIGPVSNWLTQDSSGNRTANLRYRDLSNFPTSMFKYAPAIRCLDISKNTRLQTFPFDLVQLLASHLTHLKMRGNALRAGPAHLALLRSLEVVDFSRNRLSEFPQGLEQLPHLRELILDNNLMDQIPLSLQRTQSSGSFKLLRVLKLGNNAFKAFPEFLEPNTTLELLDISFCGLGGVLPTSIANLVALRVLRVLGNKLSGELPRSIASLSSLQILDLRLNRFGLDGTTGKLAPDPYLLDVLGDLPQLCIVHLGDNPSAHLNFASDSLKAKKLKTLTLSNVGIQEAFETPEFVSIKQLLLPETLTVLDISHCRIDSLPDNLGESLPLLKRLNVSDNKLSSLDALISMVAVGEGGSRVSLSQLETLDASHNCVSQLSSEPWSHMSCLSSINLSYNALRLLPESFWHLCNLKVLNLSCNLLDAFPTPPSRDALELGSSEVDSISSLPMESTKFKNDSELLGWSLEELYLADNCLSDDIYAVLHYLPSLRVLNVAFNYITDISPWLISTPLFRQTESSSRTITADASSLKDDEDASFSIKKPWYTRLVSLSLAGNSIAFIPNEIERFHNVETLILAANRLGTVPGEVSKLRNLIAFDLSSQMGARGEGTGLRYNIANLPYDWNWSWNTKLNYLNFSGNKRLEIRPLGTLLGNSSRSQRDGNEAEFFEDLNQATSSLSTLVVNPSTPPSAGDVGNNSSSVASPNTASKSPAASPTGHTADSKRPWPIATAKKYPISSPDKSDSNSGASDNFKRIPKLTPTAPAIPITLFRRATDGLLPLALQQMILNRHESSGIAGVLDEEPSKDFQMLKHLRLLGLMDVTCLVTLPDELTQRRVRTTGSDIMLAGTGDGQIKYAISDTLGFLAPLPNSEQETLERHVALFDLVVPQFRGNDNEALFGLFDGRGSLFGSVAAKYCFDWFEWHFANEMRAMEEQVGSSNAPLGLDDKAITAVFKRTFVSVHKEVCKLLASTGSILKRKNDLKSTESHIGYFGCTATVSYLYGYTRVVAGDVTIDKCSLFVANVGDGIVALSRSQGHSLVATNLHDSRYCNSSEDLDRIRVSNGAINHQLLLEGALNITRGIGFPELTPFMSPEPHVQRVNLRMEGEQLVIDDAVDDASTDAVYPAVKRPSLPDTQIGAGSQGTGNNIVTRDVCDEFIVMASSSVWESMVSLRSKASYHTAGQRIVDLVRSALSGARVSFDKDLSGDVHDHGKAMKPGNVAPSGLTFGWSTAAIKVRDVAMSLSMSKTLDVARSKGHQGYMVMLIGLRNLTKKSKWWRNLRRSSGSAGPGVAHIASNSVSNITPALQIGVSPSALLAKPEAIPAPTGQIALVFTDIKGSTRLWESHPEAMRFGLKMHHALMREVLFETGGYEVKTEGDAFMVSFADPLAALQWCLLVQERLMELPWPTELLQTDEAGLVYYRTQGGRTIYCRYPPDPLSPNKSLLYRGICVRMGIHYGSPLCETDLVTQRMDYFGPMVNRAARTCGASMGGQVLVTGDMWRKIMDIAIHVAKASKTRNGVLPSSYFAARPVSVFREGKSFSELFPDGFDIQRHQKNAERLNSMHFKAIFLGQVKLKGLEAPEILFEVFPKHLSQRADYLAQVRKDDNVPLLELKPPPEVSSVEIQKLRSLCDRLDQFVVLDFVSAVTFENDTASLAKPHRTSFDAEESLMLFKDQIKRLEKIESKLYI